MDIADAVFDNDEKDKVPFIIRNTDHPLHELPKDLLDKLYDIHKNVEDSKNKSE